MADKISPTPIQRNRLDVATELTQLYFESRSSATVNEISEVFAKLYAIVQITETKNNSELQSLVDPELLAKFSKYNDGY